MNLVQPQLPSALHKYRSCTNGRHCISSRPANQSQICFRTKSHLTDASSAHRLSLVLNIPVTSGFCVHASTAAISRPQLNVTLSILSTFINHLTSVNPIHANHSIHITPASTHLLYQAVPDILPQLLPPPTQQKQVFIPVRPFDILGGVFAIRLVFMYVIEGWFLVHHAANQPTSANAP